MGELHGTKSGAPSNCRSIIVHPRFVHLLPAPPLAPSPAAWTHLPRDVLQLVASNLEAADLCNLAAASTELRALARDEDVWRSLCLRKFNVPLRKDPPSSWRELYKFNHHLFVQVFAASGRDDAGPQLNLQGPIVLQA